MDPILFEPVIHRAIWGGNRLKQRLGKATGDVSDAAESWEVCDLPGNQTVVSGGPHHGSTLRQLMESHGDSIMGHQSSFKRFPILVKFIDAQRQLSVQVHPRDNTVLADGTWRAGKAECWIVLESSPESRMYLGLKDGVTEEQLRDAIESGNPEVYLHDYAPEVGDCIYIDPGTVHALGGGLLIAEIQQTSDITYRLYDWKRVDSAGRPRELHLEQGLAVTNFGSGPVRPITPTALASGKGEFIMSCPHFEIHRHRTSGSWSVADDGRMHLLLLLAGMAKHKKISVSAGQTVVLPASREDNDWHFSENSEFLDVFIPLAN